MLVLTVPKPVFPPHSFNRKFVKDQKQVQEDISRMSSKAISKVQDDIKSLKQLLSVSASGLQRQGLAIDKLKLETAQVKTGSLLTQACSYYMPYIYLYIYISIAQHGLEFCENVVLALITYLVFILFTSTVPTVANFNSQKGIQDSGNAPVLRWM